MGSLHAKTLLSSRVVWPLMLLQQSLEVKEDTISSLTRRLEEAERMGEVQRMRADKLETEAAKVRSDLVAKSRDLRSFRTVVKAERVKSLGRERRNSVVKGGDASLAAIQREVPMLCVCVCVCVCVRACV